MSSKPKTKKQKKRHKFLQKMKENWIAKRRVEKQEAETARKEWNKKREEERNKNRISERNLLDSIDKTIMNIFYLL